MTESDPLEGHDPILQPRVVRLLRKRPKLVDITAREEVLESLERNIAARRDPDVVADRFSRRTLESLMESTEPVVKERVQKRIESANDGLLSRL